MHIPFCRSKCGYCDFFRTVDFSLEESFVSALIDEIEKYKNIDYKVETLYFGGGTPSSLSINSLNRIFEEIRSIFSLADLKEFTFECNPEDVSDELISCLVDGGVNRISMGVQSLDDKMLRVMNRRHNSQRVYESVDKIKSAGIQNISVDFIYGLPIIEGYSFEEDLSKILALDVNHISLYSLSYESGSWFTTLLKKNKLKAMSDDDVALQYDALVSALKNSGYEHYEVSNFSKPGFRSQHNSSYWNRKPYVGFGPSASGYDGEKFRYTNCADIRKYSGLEQAVDIDILDDNDVYNELIMLGMRTMEGVSIECFDKEKSDYFLNKVKQFIDDGSVVKVGSNFRICEEKWFISDYIISSLFL